MRQVPFIDDLLDKLTKGFKEAGNQIKISRQNSLDINMSNLNTITSSNEKEEIYNKLDINIDNSSLNPYQEYIDNRD